MRKLIRISIGVFVLGVALLALLLTASVYTFSVLTDETLIAEVRFDRIGSQQYLAHLRTGSFCDEQTLAVLGDQWRIDAQFLKWHYWATLLGLDAQYRLDRFEGRYRDVEEQNSLPTLSHSLGRDTTLDVISLSESLGSLNFLVDATYGSSTYENIDPTRIYRVYQSPTGIFTRSESRVESVGTEDALPVEVTHACADPQGFWARTVAAADGAVAAILPGG